MPTSQVQESPGLADRPADVRSEARSPEDGGASALGAPAVQAVPEKRAGLQRALLALGAVAAIAVAFRLPQMIWLAALPLIVLSLGPRGASRFLLASVGLLVVLGGAVTTYRAGMAVLDYPTTFNENMWVYSLERMLEEGRGVSLEHSHRLWASALGLVAICAVLTCHVHRARAAVTALAWAALVAISLQGLLGGTRVLENSQNLAFLHGALAQAVVALIAAFALVSSHSWSRAQPSPSQFARGAHVLGPWVAGLVYAQITLGAWLRHQGGLVPLLVHMTMALAVVVMVLVFAKQLGLAAEEGPQRKAPRAPLGWISKTMLMALVAQFVLGILATFAIYFISGGMQAEVSVGEAIFATAHVFVGAVLLCSTVAGALFARRTLLPEGAVAPAPR